MKSDNWRKYSHVAIPNWVDPEQTELQSRSYFTDTDKIELVLSCALSNAKNGAGAPLAAAVFLADGSLLSVGLDAPGIGGHEMTNALILGSNLMGSDTFRSDHTWELFSLAPPCLVCLGNIYSERPRRFVCAVTTEDLLANLSLPNVPFPGTDWIDILSKRGTSVDYAVDRGAGVQVLKFTTSSIK